MNKEVQLDYNQHYKNKLATKEELEKIRASDFLHFYSELIIKYSNQLEEKLRTESEEITNGN